MNELEINFSKYHDNASEYLSHKLNEKQSVLSEGYALSGYKSEVGGDLYRRSAEKKTRREIDPYNERYSHRQYDKDTHVSAFTGRSSLKREDLN